MYYIVYKTTNTINGKIYIGVHKTENFNIDDTYRGCGCTKKDRKRSCNTGFSAAFRKYGYSNFRREILFVFDGTENGRRLAYLKEAEIVNEDFIKRKDTYNLVIGGNCPPGKPKKQISQYTLDGKYIKTWDSIKDAETALNLTSLKAALCGKTKYCGSWQWRYGNNTQDIKSVRSRKKTVYQFDLQGNLLKVWKTAADASKQFKNPNAVRVLINNCCCKKITQAKGYFWSYVCKFTYKPIETTPVAKYTDDGKFIESYSSVSEAAESNNIKSKGNIYSAISGKQKRCGGFRWRYFYGNTSNIKPLK